MKKKNWLHIPILLGILTLAAYLRIYHNGLTPGWYNDEGTVINIAQNLIQGRFEYLGIQQSVLIAGRPPLFIWILSIAFRIFGEGIQTLRTFTGILGIINTLLIYQICRKKSLCLAAICAFSYAIMPDAVLTSRIGFSYNLLASIVLLAFWSIMNYVETGFRRFALVASILLGLGFTSDLVAVAFFPAVIIIVLWKRPKDIFLVLLLLMTPFILYSLFMLFTAPTPFIFDFGFIFFRISTQSFTAKSAILLFNIIEFDLKISFLIGILGILIAKNSSYKNALILFIFPSFFIIGISGFIGDNGIYKLIPLYPFIALGTGLFIIKIAQIIDIYGKQVTNTLNLRVKLNLKVKELVIAAINMTFIFPVMVLPIIGILISYQNQLNEYNTHNPSEFDLMDAFSRVVNLQNPFEPFVIDTNEANNVVDYINNNAKKSDVVLASPAIAWAIKKNATDYVISLAFDGKETLFFPTDIPHSRFRFNADFKQAQYIVIDNIWINFFEPNTPELAYIREAAQEMRTVYRTQNITVYSGSKQ